MLTLFRKVGDRVVKLNPVPSASAAAIGKSWRGTGRLPRILTERGTEYCVKAERHDYQLYLVINDNDHSRIACAYAA